MIARRRGLREARKSIISTQHVANPLTGVEVDLHRWPVAILYSWNLDYSAFDTLIGASIATA